MVDFALSEEQSAFRALAREFLDREAVPYRTQWDRDESVDLGFRGSGLAAFTPQPPQAAGG